MDVNTLRIMATVASFAVFMGILVWVWSKRNAPDFIEAANLPFANDKSPDEQSPRDSRNQRNPS